MASGDRLALNFWSGPGGGQVSMGCSLFWGVAHRGRECHTLVGTKKFGFRFLFR
ncbi:MAG: hypothetical protein JWR69_1322 [Pedosphaera sp.]|nr:hypothetical protein [Pedosphaera sp.]